MRPRRRFATEKLQAGRLRSQLGAIDAGADDSLPPGVRWKRCRRDAGAPSFERAPTIAIPRAPSGGLQPLTQLPHIEPKAPAAALGRSTSESIRSGIHHAAVGAARELVRNLRSECETPLRVIAAGSGGGALAAHVPEVDAVHLFATLWGVYYAARS